MRRTTFTIAAGMTFFLWTVIVAVPAHLTRAQTAPSIAPGELLMTWHTNTYVPPGFAGKALPVPGSAITISVEAIRAGRVTSLGAQTIRWYVNGDIFSEGVGKNVLRLSAPQNTFDVRVELPDETVEPTVKTISVPVVRPVVSIVAPFPNNTVRGSVAVLRAVPYFFNVTTARDLLFSWNVNDEAANSTENPDQLDLSFGGSGAAQASVEATIRNPLVTGEGGRSEIELSIASQ